MASKAVSKKKQAKNGLLPTPPMPKGLPEAKLTDNARQVLMKRYVRRGDDGKPAETVEEMFWRVSYHVAKVEEQWDADVQKRTVEYYKLLSSKKFFPNSPTFTGAGTPLGQLAACFVLPITDDMGRDSAGIFQTLRDAALIQQTGGGNGFSFSRLRPTGSLVQTSAGQATGPVGFLRVYDNAFGEIAQGGCLLPETLVFTNKGLLRLDEIVDLKQTGWQEHQFSVPTDEGVKTSPRGFNNGTSDVLRLHTRQGLSLTGTPNHKMKIMTDAGPEWKEIQHLTKGDWIIVRMGEHAGKLRILKKPTKKHGKQTMPELPSILDEEFAFFLGYLAGDGFVAQKVNDHRVGVSVAHSSYLMEEIPNMMQRLFNVAVHKMQKTNDRSVTFVMDNCAIKDFLLVNGLGKCNSREVSIPRLIRMSPVHVVGAYLRGLFEADGILTHGYPTLTTSSVQLAREVSTLLIGLGCPVNIRTVSAGLDRWGDSETYQVRITSTVGLQAWREKIGCDRRSRFVTAYAWESDVRRESSYILPNPKYWLQPVLDAITLEQIDRKGRGRNINFRATEPRLRKRILRYIRDDRNLTRSGYDLLKQEYPEAFERSPSAEGVWFVEVGDIEEVGRALTLDLEVSDNHTYLAYGMVTHNTRRGANMAVLRVDHPDVEDFITCKINENQITNFNISVGITDSFMRAVKNDEEWELRFPDMKEMKKKGFKGTIEQAEAEGITIHSYKTVKARDIFDKIVKQAHHNGEPGVLFLDAANRSNPVPHLYPLEATNPCHRGTNLVHTNLGVVPIRELVGSQFQVITPNGDFARATAYPTGIKPLFRVSFSNGATIDLTENHNLILSDGTKRKVNELNLGDQVKLSEHSIQPEFASNKFSEDEGFLLGWNAGDGWLTYHSNEKVQAWQVGFVFGKDDFEIAQKIQSQVAGRIPVRTPKLKNRPERGVVELATTNHAFVDYFKNELGAVHKSMGVPTTVLMGNREFQRGYLRGLFSADGYVSVKGKGKKERRQLGLVSAHEALVKNVQVLLSTFGIRSFVRHSESRLAGRDKLYQRWQLTVNADQFVRFMELIGFVETSLKQAAAIAVSQRNWRDTRSADYATVVSVDDLKITEEVYNITVDHPLHQFAVNGIISANCGEQWLGPYENCCLGSVNLNEHCGPDGTVDWELLRQSVVLATRFLDDVVESNAYVPAVEQLKKAAHKARRIGLGIMGLADLMYHVGVRYGSKEGQEFGSQVMEFVRYHAMQASIELAEERGPFPAIEGSIYDMDNMTWTPPQSLVKYENNWSRPEVQWDAVVDGIKKHGIRNAAQTTVAPTGTIATVAGCEGYGCEPVFALAYIRHVNDNGKDLKLTYASPRFDEALKKLGLGEEKRQEIVEQVMSEGTCQGIEEIPQKVRDTFVVSGDITAEEHVRMQGALQAFVDNSLSKTVNFHEGASEEDVAKAYMMAWELGCKGITVYVTGSRDKVVLETKATADKKDSSQSQPEADTTKKPELAPTFSPDPKKPRPRALHGKTLSVDTPVGKAFVTINENGGEQPFEAFINTAKAGSETAAVSEAIGRLISYILRITSPVKQTDRMREIVRQLLGIGGGRSLGMGPNRVRSLPDGIGQVLDMYLREKAGALPVMEEKSNGGGHTIEEEVMKQKMRIGDLCPECGQAAVVNEEGCRKCYSCGYSEC
ncbi:MAG TPA: LAGLIDADG family homing endonuclease [Anaerolineales bacterium]|nr:LAGLIDADG family homing endonuclease [Anaerolineales bacterium]